MMQRLTITEHEVLPWSYPSSLKYARFRCGTRGRRPQPSSFKYPRYRAPVLCTCIISSLRGKQRLPHTLSEDQNENPCDGHVANPVAHRSSSVSATCTWNIPRRSTGYCFRADRRLPLPAAPDSLGLCCSAFSTTLLLWLTLVM